MASTFETCTDGHKCYNGAICQEKTNDEGGFLCDCDASDQSESFSGMACEHEATVYCNVQNVVSRSSFCTNKGSCKVNVSPEAAHLGCNCPENYKGNHCQFTLNQRVDQSLNGNQQAIPGSQAPSKTSALATTSVVIIVIVVLSVVAAFGFFVIRKKFKGKLGLSEDRAGKGITPDFALEADGSVLQDSVKSGAGVNSDGLDISTEAPVLIMDPFAAKRRNKESSMENGENAQAAAYEIGSPVTSPPLSPVSVPVDTKGLMLPDCDSAPVSLSSPQVECASESTSPRSLAVMESGPSSPEEKKRDDDDYPTQPEIV